ncbi:MAG: hypothetical protein JXB49_08770 [Bacteroidales bacterium]|nr:hypothetical protein [Bacteroidales bacterium]
MDKRYLNTDDVLDQLIKKMEKAPQDFEHLKIFLKSDDSKTCPINAEFLLVTPTTLSKVKLLDVSVEYQFVILNILDCQTQLTGNFRIDINDIKPQTFFVRWSDIKRMVMYETISGINRDDLLEFEF